jgi:hypothetical protein
MMSTMRHPSTGCRLTIAIVFAVGMGAGPWAGMPRQGQTTGDRQPSSDAAGSQAASVGTTKEQLEQWMTTLSNWGRWGKDDELGTVNLITPAKRKQALALDLEAVAETAAEQKRWEFLFIAAPLPAATGTGSAINPIAVF